MTEGTAHWSDPLAPVDGALDERIAAAIDLKTKPPGSLGEVETLAKRIARIRRSVAPPMARCVLTIFAGDHGIARAGVSAYPAEVTRQMVLNFLAGGAAANVFARSNGVGLRVVDTGVAGEVIEHPELVSRRIGNGTRNAVEEPAMTLDEASLALSNGHALALGEDCEAAAFGEMGIGNTSAATLVTHKIAGIPLATLTGAGTGLDADGVSRKLEILGQAAARTDTRLEPLDALAQYGGFEMATMAGAMIGAARAGQVVLVDGFIATASAVVAVELAPTLGDYLVFSHRSAERGHDALLDRLGAKPLLDLRLRLGEGTGALLAWPLVACAAAMLRDMASFESAGVSGPA